MQEYLSMFIDETREHLQAWSDGMIGMEKTGDTSALSTIFRAAHTIKGMSMTMGFTRMGQVTHGAENLLDDLRNNLMPLSTPIIDALLHSLDVLEGLLNSIEETGQEANIDVRHVSEELLAVKEGRIPKTSLPPKEEKSASPPAIVQQDLIHRVAGEAMNKGFRVYEILIGFDPGCIMPLARFAQILQRIDQNNLLYTHPDAAVLDAGNYGGDITIVMASTHDYEVVGEFVSDISEVIIKSVAEWTREAEGNTFRKTENLLPPEGHVSEDSHVRNVIEQALRQGLHVYEIGILLAETCKMKSARMFTVFEALGGQNHILYTDPHIQLIEQEKMDRHVLCIIWSRDDLQTIEKVVQSVSEVEVAELREWRSTDTDEAKRGGNEASEAAGVKPAVAQERKKINTIRVDTEKLDDLMNLVSELAIDKTRLERIQMEVAHAGLTETVDHMSRLSSQLQELIMSIRMIPLESVFNRFSRMVRDTAQQLGKEIEFTITGQETELDRTVVEEIGDPIMHMLRNSLDHGIESAQERRRNGKPEVGHIELRAYAAGNHVFIEVEDDGGGINRDKVFKKAVEKGLVSANEHLTDHQVFQLLFASGFSTADKVSDLSGRGVGLDVVKAKIESLSGKVDIYSEVGKGTKFVIRLPMTLAIMDGLMVKVADHPYLIPIGSITETSVLTSPQRIHTGEVVVWRGKLVPIVRARAVFGEPSSADSGFVVFVNRGDKVVGIVVDELLGQFEVVLKTLDARLKKIPYFAGATILGDGEVSLIMDANAFIE